MTIIGIILDWIATRSLRLALRLTAAFQARAESALWRRDTLRCLARRRRG
jgi:hypothetical protein